MGMGAAGRDGGRVEGDRVVVKEEVDDEVRGSGSVIGA
jgi:hypothetical protein